MRVTITKPKSNKSLGVVKAEESLERKVIAEIKEIDPVDAKDVIAENVIQEGKAVEDDGEGTAKRKSKRSN